MPPFSFSAFCQQVARVTEKERASKALLFGVSNTPFSALLTIEKTPKKRALGCSLFGVAFFAVVTMRSYKLTARRDFPAGRNYTAPPPLNRRPATTQKNDFVHVRPAGAIILTNAKATHRCLLGVVVQAIP